MVDSLDGLQGNTYRLSSVSIKRGWACPGCEDDPWISTPWPQDFVIGRNRFLYDDLDTFRFVQGCIAIVKQQIELSLIKLMLAQLRATMRDVSFPGYELARYTYGIVLSMLEDALSRGKTSTGWQRRGGQP
jgi:hypothetical protein